MTSVCFCLGLHQPYHLQPYDFFRIGHDHAYFDGARDQSVLSQLTQQAYAPATQRLLRLAKKTNGGFRMALAASGTALEQLDRYQPALLADLQRLTATGSVEILGQCYYRANSFLHSPAEFERQVRLHGQLVGELFDASPRVFRNTEALYGNDIARVVEAMGYGGILSDGTDTLLMGRSPNHVYLPLGTRRIRALLRNEGLSEDLGLRFGDTRWPEYPLTPGKFVAWLRKLSEEGAATINIVLDFRDFAQPGLLTFFEEMALAVVARADLSFHTPSEVLDRYAPKGTYDVPYASTWAERGRDLPAWMDNYLQREAIARVYSLEAAVRATHDQPLLRTWSYLQSSDHFYRMSNREPTRFDAYITYMNILTDLEQRLG